MRSFVRLGIIVALGSFLLGCATPVQHDVNLKPGATFKDCVNCPDMVVIPAGSFVMGSPPDEDGRQGDEDPQHRVTITKTFAVSKFEVTLDQYRYYTNERGIGSVNWHVSGYSATPDGDYPVFWLSWYDANDYVQWLSRQTGKQYRLLTEAEWEYAARAGTPNTVSLEPVSTKTRQGNPQPVSSEDTFPVGSFQPNAFGVYDMTGNIPEWTEDCYIRGYASAPSDGSAVEGACERRVVRGGYTFSGEEFQRIANRKRSYAVDRNSGSPIGFRVARVLP